ncbi:fibroblast growth factor receptor 3 [Lasius niger]|uniref:Fibroblast growth factor receptor 3 n=1 Tax=Lasius niger TaxID=67767 RepID=A0A0J7MYZ5_LASNI|nr:fibroblast growth factor receptor 3 [Lasius niger]
MCVQSDHAENDRRSWSRAEIVVHNLRTDLSISLAPVNITLKLFYGSLSENKRRSWRKLDDQPRKVDHISLLKIKEDSKNVCELQAEIIFEPAEAPEKVKGLRAEHIRKHQGLYDIAVSWNKPILQPDNYTVQFDSFRFEPSLLIVSGVSVSADALEAFFLNVDVGPQYEISIVAESMGGVSLQSTISGNIDEVVELSYREIIIALPTLMIIAVVFGVICMQHHKKKNKKINMEYMHFEDSMDYLKKPLKRDYAVENGDTLLPYDKFELNSQKLKLKGVLGSGAYGIVRLASLQDEFGDITDVAVKMMKGIMI